MITTKNDWNGNIHHKEVNNLLEINLKTTIPWIERINLFDFLYWQLETLKWQCLNDNDKEKCISTYDQFRFLKYKIEKWFYVWIKY